MSTQYWNSAVDHTTTGGFQAWGSEFNSKMAATGILVQTADTGQIDWTSAALPAANAFAGYEIWEMNDSLFSEAPVYFKIRYGSNPESGPQIAVTVGTSTNGAGVLGGTCLSLEYNCCYNYSSPPANTSTHDSYLCAVNGFFGFYWKCTGSASGAAPGSDASFFFQRSCDTTGAPAALGAFAYWPNGLQAQTFRYAAPASAFPVQTNARFCLIYQNLTSTLDDDGNHQCFVHYTVTPTVRPLMGTCTILGSDVGQGVTFTATLVGTTPHTYMALRQGANGIGAGFADSNNSSSFAIAMLWE